MVQCGLVRREICRVLWHPGCRRYVELDHTLACNMVFEVGPRVFVGPFGSGERKPKRRRVDEYRHVLPEGEIAKLPFPLGNEGTVMVFLCCDIERSESMVSRMEKNVA